jgi:membrane dipeptidase
MKLSALTVLLFLFSIPVISLAQSNNKLHFKAIVADTHNDVISTVTLEGMNIENDLSGKTHTDIARLKKGGVDIQVFSIFCDERYGKGTAFNRALREIDSLDAIVKRNPATMTLVNTAAELKKAIKQKKIACLKGVEGGHMIEDNLQYLDSLFARGARYMTLTWNNSTSWASSAVDEKGNTVPNPKKGLNDFGKQVVKRMNELGMIVDISHVGEQTFWDAISVTTKPVIASHSCVYSICPVPRNLNDEQIKAVGKNDGVVCINFYSGFLDSTYLGKQKTFVAMHRAELDSLKSAGKVRYEIEDWLYKKYSSEIQVMRPPLSLLIDHIDHIVKLIGADHVGLGSDFDGIESSPIGLDGVQDFPNITAALLQRGYSKKEVKKILGVNFVRVFKANM